MWIHICVSPRRFEALFLRLKRVMYVRASLQQHPKGTHTMVAQAPSYTDFPTPRWLPTVHFCTASQGLEKGIVQPFAVPLPGLGDHSRRLDLSRVGSCRLTLYSYFVSPPNTAWYRRLESSGQKALVLDTFHFPPKLTRDWESILRTLNASSCIWATYHVVSCHLLRDVPCF